MRAVGVFASMSFALTAATAAVPSTAYLPLRALPNSLDPAALKVANDSYIFRQMAEGLFSIGEAFQVVPRLADSLEWADGQKTLRVKLRPAKFSDGSPVTAAAVADSLSYCIRNDKKTLLVAVRAIEGYAPFSRGQAPSLSGLRVSEPIRIEIHLTRPAPLLLDDLAQADCHIVKPAPGGSRDLLKGALGSGPYALKSAGPTELVLERNPHYYAPLTGPENAVFRVTNDYGRFEALKPWVTVATVDSHPAEGAAFHTIEISELGAHQLILNNSKAPFNDKRVRQAVGLALDYGLLAGKLGWSPDTLQASLVPLGITGFRRRDLGERKQALARAARLLKSAGYGADRPLRFTVLLSKLPDYEKEASLWPALFSGVPIEARVELVSHADRIERADRGDFQAVRGIKYAGSSEAHRLLSSYLSGSTYNPTKSRTPRCDTLIASAISTLDREGRLRLYAEADSCLMKEAVLVPLASLQSGYVMLRKGLALFVPIRVEERRLSAILIDDDVLTRQTWTHVAKSAGRRILTVDRLSGLDGQAIPLDTAIYVDRHLSTDVRGEDVLRELYGRGFHRLHLFTGDTLSDAERAEVEGFCKIVGKSIPPEVYGRL